MSGFIKSGGTLPLAQLPAGTANLLARALSIPTGQADALDTVFAGTATRLDVGYLSREDRYFALVAGAGCDALLIGDASRELKNALGFAAYIVTGIKNLFTLRPARIELEVDGQRLLTQTGQQQQLVDRPRVHHRLLVSQNRRGLFAYTSFEYFTL